MFPNSKSFETYLNSASSSSFINHHICNFSILLFLQLHLLLHSSFFCNFLIIVSATSPSSPLIFFLQLSNNCFSNFPMNMNMDIYPHLYPHDDDDDNDILSPVSLYVWPCGTRVRVYSVSPIVSGDFHPEVLAQSLRFYRPLPYPYTWYVRGEEAAIVNIIDLQAHHQLHQQSSSYYQPQEEAMDHGYPYQHSEAIDDGYLYQHNSEYVDETAILEDLNMNQINESFQQASDQLVAFCSGLTNKLISNNLKNVCPLCKAQALKVWKMGSRKGEGKMASFEFLDNGKRSGDGVQVGGGAVGPVEKREGSEDGVSEKKERTDLD
ncbi:hypothetical protein L6452_41142 [Arctium lappa]|uniref:Uncharacterized protein n=1 Tax=Arctium lappa TaxID=4217 RepID=A0ACB8XPB4_ARCLA|nr:hypothetical protein L6452_41142 [Arctium lappa]